MNTSLLPQTDAVRKFASKTAIDRAEAKRHLDALTGLDSAKEEFLFVALDDRKEGRSPVIRYGSLDQHADELGHLNAKGFGVFVTVNKTASASRKARDVITVRAQFVDLDGEDVKADLRRAVAWSLKPHFVVQSSRGRCHVYWRVAGSDVDEVGFRRRQKKLAQLFNGDPNVCDLPRVMRLAGSWHMKGKAYRCRGETVAMSGAYRPDQFDEALADVRLPSTLAGTGGPGLPIGHPAHLAPSIDLAVEALKSIACAELDRHDWVAVTHAFKAAVGSDDLDAYFAFDDWCSGYPDNTPEGNEKLWNSVTTSRVGWNELVRRADRRILYKFASCLFDDLSDATETEQPDTGDKWPEPEDLWNDDARLPDFPEKAAPEIIERFAADRAKRLGVDRGVEVAVTAAAWGSLVPSTNEMQMRQHDPHWTVRPNLWCALVGDSGKNKSAALLAPVRPIHGVEEGWRAGYAREQAQREAIKALGVDDENTGETKRGAKSSRAPQPVLRRKIINDATTEAIAALARDNPDGLLSFHDELAGLFGSLDAYRSGGAGRIGKDRSFWLTAKDGGAHTVDRKTSDPIIIENCSISVLGAIQPARLSGLVNEMTQDGFLQRFWMVPLTASGPGADVPPDEELDAQVARMVARLANEAPRGLRFRFAPEANAIFRDIDRIAHAEAEREDLPSPVRQWASKLPNEFGRLALVFHFIEWATCESDVHPFDDVPDELVPRETAEQARRFLVDFIYPRVQHVFGNAGDQQTDNARWLAGVILAREMREIRDRDIQRAGRRLKGRNKRGERIDALDELRIQGWIAPQYRDGGKIVGWLVNPKVHSGRFSKTTREERERREAARIAIAECAITRTKRKGGQDV